MSQNETIIAKAHDFLYYMIPQLDKLPRNRKFLLGDRIENHILDLLELYVQALYSPRNKKPEFLKSANLKLEMLRHLIRICFEMKYINIKKYETISKQINEIGAMTGGWIKSL